MSAAIMRRESVRRNLTRAILGVLDSWPVLHRQVFVQSHYGGVTAAQIARSLDLDPDEVRSILDRCGRRLRAALRAWREEVAGCEAVPAAMTPVDTLPIARPDAA